jgi:biopolymer transport protein ExbD
MARGGHRFGRPRPAGRGAVVEMTPLIDIVFQLLIFFLLTATFQDQSSLDVDLARAKSQERSAEAQKVVVSIATDGRFEIDNVVVEENELELRLCAHAQKGDKTLHIRADRESQHAYLVSVMDIGKRCEFSKMGILHQN